MPFENNSSSVKSLQKESELWLKKGPTRHTGYFQTGTFPRPRSLQLLPGEHQASFHMQVWSADGRLAFNSHLQTSSTLRACCVSHLAVQQRSHHAEYVWRLQAGSKLRWMYQPVEEDEEEASDMKEATKGADGKNSSADVASSSLSKTSMTIAHSDTGETAEMVMRISLHSAFAPFHFRRRHVAS